MPHWCRRWTVLPGIGRPVTNGNQVPAGMIRWAEQEGIAFLLPKTADLSTGHITVTELVLS